MTNPFLSRATLVLAGILLLGASTFYFKRSARQAPARPDAATNAVVAPVRIQPSAKEHSDAAPQLNPDSVEASLMKRLHELGETDPPAALELALEGNARFPSSSSAPERGWVICRSLVSMQRFDEAVAEARLVVERYPSTPWALDVERHLLINPMSDPSERGSGKRFELD
jgi:hypothetical protein